MRAQTQKARNLAQLDSFAYIIEQGHEKNNNMATVNLKIFARILFSQNFAYAKFRENKILLKWRDHSVDY